MTNLIPKTMLPVSLHACQQHHVSYGAASICMMLFSIAGLGRCQLAPADLADVFSESESWVKARMQEAKQMGMMSYFKEEGYGVTPAFHQAFILEVQDVKTKVRECAEAFAHALSKYGQGRGIPTKETVKLVAKQLKDKDNKHLKPGHFGLVVDWAASVEYTKPEMRKYLRPSTLLNGKFPSRVENALTWRAGVVEKGLFHNQK